MNYKTLALLAVMAGLAAAARTSAQSGTVYADTVNRYKILVIGDWRAVSYSDAVGRPMTDFVYRDRSEGLMKIVRENLGTRSLSDFAQDEEESMRIAHAGFERGETEEFAAGDLHGLRMSYFYMQGSKPIAVTNYFLKDGNQLWALRFTGKRGILDQIRNVTDEMARSFRLDQ
jgi:hypothetical protein